MGKLDGRVALVTGASRGIGRAIARGLVSEGASVVLTARARETLDQTAAELAARGARVFSHPADIALDLLDFPSAVPEHNT